jgi:hypothetical protein
MRLRTARRRQPSGLFDAMGVSGNSPTLHDPRFDARAVGGEAAADRRQSRDACPCNYAPGPDTDTREMGRQRSKPVVCTGFAEPGAVHNPGRSWSRTEGVRHGILWRERQPFPWPWATTEWRNPARCGGDRHDRLAPGRARRVYGGRQPAATDDRRAPANHRAGAGCRGATATGRAACPRSATCATCTCTCSGHRRRRIDVSQRAHAPRRRATSLQRCPARPHTGTP